MQFEQHLLNQQKSLQLVKQKPTSPDQLQHIRLNLNQLRESQSPTLLSKLLIQRLEWKSRKWRSERKNV
jgi:hypothetical protein